MANANSPQTNPTFTIKLESIERLNNNITANLIVNTNLPQYRRQKYAPVRSLAEILRLHKYLQSSFPEYILPVPPFKSSKIEVIARGIEKFFTRVASKTRLRTSDGVIQFIESEFAFVQTTSPIVPKRTKSVLQSFIPGSQPTKDIDPYFENAKQEEDAGVQQMQSWIRLSDKLARVYKDHGYAVSELANRLSATDFGFDSTTQCARKFSKSLRAIEDYNNKQAIYIGTTFAEHCHAQLCNFESAGVSLACRYGAVTNYEAACKNTTKKVNVIERLKSGGSLRQDRVDSALEDLADAKRVEAEAREQMKRMTDVLRTEYVKHNETMYLDGMRDLHLFAEQMVESAEKEIRAFESCLD
ncbi:Vacuolar protein sorting-associated protein 17 [Nowakowskiella sp. JEL0407]|nr:Vacuolar protein sorting-associated protein 17 [Nowakowskiella sp. JEL0407]